MKTLFNALLVLSLMSTVPTIYASAGRGCCKSNACCADGNCGEANCNTCKGTCPSGDCE